jgi:hypothetical protein
MPATRAALGFLPMARNSNPVVVRYSSHHTPNAHASAIRNDTLIRSVEPNRCGRCASPAMNGLIRSVRPGRCMTLPSRYESR